MKGTPTLRGHRPGSAILAFSPTTRAKRRLAGVAALVCILIQLAPPAGAQGAVELQVEVGYENRYVPGQWMPASVTVESSRAVAGDLEISYEQPDGTRARHSVSVEVPAGGKKRGTRLDDA